MLKIQKTRQGCFGLQPCSHPLGVWVLVTPEPVPELHRPALGVRGLGRARGDRDGSAQQPPHTLPCSFPQIMHNVSLS